MTQRLDKLNKQHNGKGSRPKLEPWHKWVRGPIKIKLNTVTRTKWGVYIYICDYMIMSTTWIFIIWWYYVVLRAPMDDIWQRSHMGRYYFHSIEAIWELITREEWLGCRHDVAHVGYTRVNTSVGSLYIVFGDRKSVV